MKINTALILCAGFGKRLNPITLNTPKPLLEIKDVSMLERCINLIEKLGIQKILINTFYLKDQFSVFLNSKNFNIDIKIIEDGEHILDTGGGIQNMIKNSNEKDFIIFNPDTIWSNDYKDEILKMEKMYFSEKLENILLLVNKKLSFDKKLKGDFNLKNNLFRLIVVQPGCIFKFTLIIKTYFKIGRGVLLPGAPILWLRTLPINPLHY